MLLPRFYPKKKKEKIPTNSCQIQQIQFPFVQKAKTIWFSLTTEANELFGKKKKHIVQILDLFSWNQCFHFQFLHFGRTDLNDPIWGQNQPFRDMWLQSTPHLERFLVKYISFLVFFPINLHEETILTSTTISWLLLCFILYSFFSLPDPCIAPAEFSDASPDYTCMVDIEGRGFYLISIGPIILLDLDPIEYWSFFCQQ